MSARRLRDALTAYDAAVRHHFGDHVRLRHAGRCGPELDEVISAARAACFGQDGACAGCGHSDQFVMSFGDGRYECLCGYAVLEPTR